MKKRRGQAAIEYVAVLTLMLILLIALGMDLMQSAIASTGGADADALLKKTAKDLGLAVWEVENLQTFRRVQVTVPADCEYRVYENAVWSYCQVDPSDPSRIEKRVLAASKKVSFGPDPPNTVGDMDQGTTSTGVITVAPAQP